MARKSLSCQVVTLLAFGRVFFAQCQGGGGRVFGGCQRQCFGVSPVTPRVA